jgi:glyoxylase-like metal-dependent hydrolase (beta-lactamase superfamily II)
MNRRLYASVFALSVTVACASATPEQQIVNDAAAALGGADKVSAVKTLVVDGTGTQYNLGQDVVPGAKGQTFTMSAFKRAVDVAGGRARTELTRTPNFTYFQGPAPQTQISGIDGAVAYNVAPNGTATRAADPVAADRKAELLHHPLAAVRASLNPMAKLSNPRTGDGQSSVDVATPDGQAFTLSIDATTKLPSRVTTRSDNVNLGDVVIGTTFADYQDVGGLKLPAKLTTATDDFLTQEVSLAKQEVDVSPGDLAAPANAAKAPATAGPPPPMVTVEPLAKGLWWLAGGSHHSVLVEFADHLTLIEAPLNEARVLAVIAKARELVPGKPLTQVVNTHHHFDHTGGIRAAMSEGLTVITHQGNVAFFEEVGKRAHTIVPDAMGTSGKAPIVEGVEGRRTMTDGTMAMDLMTVSGAHSQTMLVAHFPKQKLLVEVDVYTPGAAANMFAKAFFNDVQARRLAIDRIVPLHGGIAPYAQFVKEASAPQPGE